MHSLQPPPMASCDLARRPDSNWSTAQQCRTKAGRCAARGRGGNRHRGRELAQALEEQSKRQTAEAKQKGLFRAGEEGASKRPRASGCPNRGANGTDEARKQAELAQQQAEAPGSKSRKPNARRSAEAQLQVEQAKRAAREDAEKMLPLTPNASGPQKRRRLLQRSIRRHHPATSAHLKAVGCNLWNVDGQWDESSKKKTRKGALPSQ